MMSKWFAPMEVDTLDNGICFYKQNNDWLVNEVIKECKTQFKSLKLPIDTCACVQTDCILVFNTWMDFKLRLQICSIEEIFEHIGYTTLHQSILIGMYDRIMDMNDVGNIGASYVANLLLDVVYHTQPNKIMAW